jgi:glycogen debranching enzyme
MDFRHNAVLKSHYTFFVGDSEGQIRGGEQGLYNRDTRLLSGYRWEVESEAPLVPLVAGALDPEHFHAHHAWIDGPSQQLALRRNLTLKPTGLCDQLTLENSGRVPRKLRLRLWLAADFADLFEARGWSQVDRPPPRSERTREQLRLRATASDGLEQWVELRVAGGLHLCDDGAEVELELAPGARVDLTAIIELHNPLDDGATITPIDPMAWRADFAELPRPRDPRPLERAIEDLRALLLYTPHGPLPAAGIPWFVATFGRDALITALMIARQRPDVAEGTLRFLATHQGRVRDSFRAEAPGKILHEMRYGELSRTGKTPHARYYGTVDATPLFLMLLDAQRRISGSDALVRELRSAWEAALAWMTSDADADGDGFLEFTPALAGEGLSVQSWKDSGDSMSHVDGSLAEGALAVSEVQGYAYAAYRAAAGWYRELGEEAAARAWTDRAEALQRAFHAAYWLEELGTYAMALDGAKRPLAVQNSDAGQLLWTGIVPASVAPRLVATLFSEVNWSGWGLRTLGSREVRYNPVSYHNGSVWPHDTALFAAGLARYGFAAEARRVRDALFDLASAQPDQRLPELVAGYPRDHRPPIPYPVACRPQAWDAAALPFLLSLDGV